MLSRKRECSQLMTEREFEEFWQTVDSRHRGLSPAKQLRRRAEEQARAHAQVVEPTLDDDGVAGPANPQSTAAAKSAKTARCGSCEACRAKDCGECSQSWLRRVWVSCAGGGVGGVGLPFPEALPTSAAIAPGQTAQTRLTSSSSSPACFSRCVCAGKNCLDKPR